MIIGKKYQVISENDVSSNNCKTYVCENLITNDIVFIKKLKTQNIGSEVAKELFYRESKSLALLNHKNIIKYIDSGMIGEEPYIVTEHFKDRTLYSYIKDNNLDIEEKFNITLDIIAGLIHAHEKKVIHRDIKPQNILIDDDRNIKIIDFGISKIIGMFYDSTVTVKDYMSSRYAAPEQFLRLEARIESDLFSLGLLLAFIFTEQEPPDDRSKLNNYINTIEEPQLRSLVRELLNEDFNKRPKSAYKIENVINGLKINSIASNHKVYFKPLLSASQKLYTLGMVSSENNYLENKYFITGDTKVYNAYKIKDKYFFIGSKIKYSCNLSSDQSYFQIFDVNYIDDQINYEKELSKGKPLYIPWIIMGKTQSPSEPNDINEVVQLLSNFEREKINLKEKAKIENKLLRNWEILIDDEFRTLDEKKNIGNYSNIKYEENGDRVCITIKNCTTVLNNNDLLQLSLLGGNQQKTVGYFDGLIDSHTIAIKLNENIDIDEFNKMGILSLDTNQEKVNLRRYMRALNSVRNRDTYNPNIYRILNDPSIATMNKLVPIDQFFQEVFSCEDSPSSMAVKKALATKDIFLLQGPPGTGKTTVITEIICQILKAEENAKVLLTSQSNPAVDHAVKKLEKLLPDRRIIRIGRSNKIAKSSEHLQYSNQIEKWISDVRESSSRALYNYLKAFDESLVEEELYAYMNTLSLMDDSDIEINKQLPNLKDTHAKMIFNIINQWQKRLGKLDDFDEIFADKASVVAATCMGIASRNKLGELEYDWVIIDEAAKATPLETLVPLVRGKKIILVGDHRQLPPTVSKNLDREKLKRMGLKKTDLEKSLFEELIEAISREAKTVLTEQFRMHPAISDMISEVFYPSENIVSNISPSDRQHMLRWGNKPIIWINTDKLKHKKETPVAFSKKNQAEASAIKTLMEEINKQYERLQNGNTRASVGIISGYDAQRKLLNDLINPEDTNKWKAIDISIDTVDAFQGSEVDIVVYSIVRCNDINEIGFLSDERRLNVALSRGRNCVIIVGSLEFIKTAKGIGGNPFALIVKYIGRNREYCTVEAINE